MNSSLAQQMSASRLWYVTNFKPWQFRSTCTNKTSSHGSRVTEQHRTHDDVAQLIEFDANVQSEEATFMNMIHEVNSSVRDQQVDERRTVMYTVQIASEAEEGTKKVFYLICWEHVDHGTQTGVVA